MKPVILTAIEGNPVKLTTSEAPMGSPGAPLDPERIPPDRGPGPPDGPSPLPRPGSPGSPIEASYPPGSYGGRRCPCHRRALRRPNSGELSRRDCPGPSDPACRNAEWLGSAWCPKVLGPPDGSAPPRPWPSHAPPARTRAREGGQGRAARRNRSGWVTSPPAAGRTAPRSPRGDEPIPFNGRASQPGTGDRGGRLRGPGHRLRPLGTSEAARGGRASRSCRASGTGPVVRRPSDGGRPRPGRRGRTPATVTNPAPGPPPRQWPRLQPGADRASAGPGRVARPPPLAPSAAPRGSSRAAPGRPGRPARPRRDPGPSRLRRPKPTATPPAPRG